MQRILFATAVTLAALAARPAVCAPSPEARYEAAVKVLSGCQYCEGIRDTPEDLDALNAAWTATQDWTVEYLNAHPNTTAEKLRTVFLNGHPGYQPLPAEGHLVYVPQQAAPDDVTRLGPDLFGFGAGNGTGNVFLVAKRDGRFQVVWDVRNLPGDQISKFPVLTAWSAVGARGSCRSKATEGKWNQCGPIGGSFERLPPDAQIG